MRNWLPAVNGRQQRGQRYRKRLAWNSRSRVRRIVSRQVHCKGSALETPNDLKLSERGARRGPCVGDRWLGWLRRWEAWAVTRGTVRCSAWLGVALAAEKSWKKNGRKAGVRQEQAAASGRSLRVATASHTGKQTVKNITTHGQLTKGASPRVGNRRSLRTKNGWKME